MADRDVEKEVPKKQFIETLRRIADSLEKDESFRIQIAGKRLTIPADAYISVEHEAEDDEHEVELQFRWKS